MNETRPAYYDEFRCLAAACPDSCCKDWEIQVDPDAARRYRQLPGPLGERLRRVLREENGQTLFALTDRKRCPMWREDGLCRLQAELGEQALCRTCRDYPRLTHDYGILVERDLELSCPRAAELILASPEVTLRTEELPDREQEDVDLEAMASLLASREQALALVKDPERSPAEALALLLLFGAAAQEALDLGEETVWDAAAAEQTAADLAVPGDRKGFREFFLGLELLTPEWEQLLRAGWKSGFPEQTRAMAAYLIRRWWLQAVSDLDLMSRVKLVILSCLLAASLETDFCRAAQLFSREIENDADNTDALLDAAWDQPAFTDSRILGMLLGR